MSAKLMPRNALLSLLMVSLWHNHWVTAGLAATLGPARADSVAA